MKEKTIANYQSKLLELLDTKQTPDEIKEELLKDQDLKELHDYLSKIEPRMLEVASELVKKWGHKKF